MRRAFSLFLLVLPILLIASSSVLAQNKDYKPGEKIEWKSADYPETWSEATFLRATPDGRQPIIREKPNEFHKDGFERATQWDNIRRPLPKAPPAPAGSITKGATPPGAPIDEMPPNTKKFGTGLMTQAEVLGYLQAELGDNPFQNPRREDVKKQLVDMMKARGLDFRYSTPLTDFNAKLSKLGAGTSEVVFPLRDNYGEPTKQSWIMGTWKLGKIGAAVDTVKRDGVYRQSEIGVSNVGTLSLNANGTYVWKAGAKDSTAGQWRPASGAEMKSQGGAGIVLLKAKGGEDWIVMQDRNTTLAGDWINVYQLNWRQIREYGSRAGKR
jgi:hypothetical protein